MFNLKKEIAFCSRGERRWLLLAHGILWASLMIAVALVSKAAEPKVFGYLLTLVLLPGWLASEQILRRALRAQPTGGACP